jgi:hypothetical protein
LELKGLNIRDTEADQIKLVMTDYLAPFQEEKARADRLAEENAALQAQIDAMGNRPRPPRPSMN